jgi:YfiR/HmsC-like
MMNICRQKRTEWRSRCGRRSVFGVDPSHTRQASIFGIIACGLFFIASPSVFSQKEEGAEYPVKLAFLYNFTKFIEWPPDSYHAPGAPLLMCIVGHDPFSRILESDLGTRNVGGHPVEVRTLKPNDKLSVCQIVFLPAAEKQQAERIVKGLKGSSTLTVGESDGFAEMGGIINLTIEANKVHFEVNRLAAERAGLKISSRLLSIAKIVHEPDQTRQN